MLTVNLTVREAQALASTAQVWSAALEEDVARYLPDMPPVAPLVSACMRLEIALALGGSHENVVR